MVLCTVSKQLSNYCLIFTFYKPVVLKVYSLDQPHLRPWELVKNANILESQ